MKKDIMFINKNSNVAICTLWSKKEDILQRIPEKQRNKIAIIGTLYSKYGINYLFETLGQWPNLNTVLVYGADLSESGERLVKAFKDKALDSLRLEKNKALEIIRTTKLIDLRQEFKNNNIEALLKEIDNNFGKGPKRRKIDIKIQEKTENLDWPWPLVNIRIHETSIFWAWIKLLYGIHNFGTLKFSEYSENQKEIVNLSVTIHVNDLKYELEKEFEKTNLDITRFEKHVKEILEPYKPESIDYTYGQRLRDHPLVKDQISFIINKLGSSPYSRRAVAITWHHPKDQGSKNPPCIIMIQGLFSKDLYHHNVVLRSNDMYDAWPINMYGQIKLAEYIVSEINKAFGTNYKIGTVTTTSISAHIYEHSFEDVKELLSKYKDQAFKRLIPDQIGNFIISKDHDHLTIEHRVDDEIFFKKSYKDLEEAYWDLKAFGLFLDPQHSLYLGKELTRAFYEKEYKQK